MRPQGNLQAKSRLSAYHREPEAKPSARRSVKRPERRNMVKHIVMWKCKASGAQRVKDAALMKAALESMKAGIPEIRHLEAGINFNATDGAYDVVLCTEFDSREALNAYATHPEHEKVKKIIGPLREKRVVVDYEH